MRILYLTHRLPYAPNRGDRIRSYYMLREMSRFAAVSLFSLVHDDDEASHVDRMPFATDVTVARPHAMANRLRGAAGVVLRSSTPLTHHLLDAPGVEQQLGALVRRSAPDLIVSFCSGMARFAFSAPLADRPMVLDMVDVDSAKWRDLAVSSSAFRRWIFRREAAVLGRFEQAAVAKASCTFVVNDRERSELERLAPGASIMTIENGIEVQDFRPHTKPADSANVVFCGVMDYQPNDEGVRWFAQQVWPAVRARRSDARFVIVGPGATPALKAIAARDDSIQIMGAVPAVQPYLWEAAVSVAPLLVARGLQNKVLEAIAAGLPVVATAAVMGGLPAPAHAACVAANQPDDFAAKVNTLLAQTPQARREIASQASLEGLDWKNRLGPIEQVCRAAVSAPGGRLQD